MLKNIPVLKYFNSLKMSHITIFVCYLALIFFVYMQHDLHVSCKQEASYHNCVDMAGYGVVFLWLLWVAVFGVLITGLFIEIGVKAFRKSSKNKVNDNDTLSLENERKFINNKYLVCLDKVVEPLYAIYYVIGLLLIISSIFLPLVATTLYRAISVN